MHARLVGGVGKSGATDRVVPHPRDRSPYVKLFFFFDILPFLLWLGRNMWTTDSRMLSRFLTPNFMRDPYIHTHARVQLVSSI
jgi:hypothetical protein